MSPQSIGRLCAAGLTVLVLVAATGTAAPADAQTHAELQTHA
jgi:hypothetical protein